ncbi:TPA: hypothetical protein QCX53_005620 [Bacillus cereus]|nr:hypothetical protein [Bacillus cereus]
MGAAALIPYGGIALSPLIGLLWPEDQTQANNQLKELMLKIAEQTHEQIKDYDLHVLRGAVKDLKNKMKEFENLVNNSAAYYSNDHLTSKQNVQNKAVNLNDLFRTVITKDCQKGNFKNSELPIYMTVAISHMQFMKFIKQHGKSLLHFDDKVLHHEFLSKQEAFNKEYIN